MTITIRVPTQLRGACDGARELVLEARTVRQALSELERDFPALHRKVCDESGTPRRHMNLFVNRDNIRDRNGLDTSLAGGDVITILPAVSGG